MSKKTTPFPLRMEPKLKIKAEEQAKKERRSLNAWIQVAIEDRLEVTERKGEAAA